jgi:hypothetical protein
LGEAGTADIESDANGDAAVTGLAIPFRVFTLSGAGAGTGDEATMGVVGGEATAVNGATGGAVVLDDAAAGLWVKVGNAATAAADTVPEELDLAPIAGDWVSGTSVS